MVEIDSQYVAQLVQQLSEATNKYTPLVRSLENFYNVIGKSLCHVYREANSIVDFVVNYVLSLPFGFHRFFTHR